MPTFTMMVGVAGSGNSYHCDANCAKAQGYAVIFL